MRTSSPGKGSPMEPGFFSPLKGLEKFIPVSDMPSRSTGSLPKAFLIRSKSLTNKGAEPEVHNRIWPKSRVSSRRKSNILEYIEGTAIKRVHARFFLSSKTGITVSGEKASNITT